MRNFSARITVISLGLAFSTCAMAGSLQSGAIKVAQVQNQNQNQNVNRERERKKETVQQRSRERQNVRERERPTQRQPGPTFQRSPQQQTRERTQFERRQQAPRTPDIRQRYNWQQYRPGQRPPEWREHRGINPRLWERNFSATQRYRWGPYYRPDGWYYRRWTFGMVLPSIFWTRNYWIMDYWMFDLMNPPYGYVWVRYGDDALLVNVQTGLILRVVYSVFY